MADDRYVDEVVLVDSANPHVRLMSNNGEILLASESYSSYEWAEKVVVRLASQLGIGFKVMSHPETTEMKWAGEEEDEDE